MVALNSSKNYEYKIDFDWEKNTDTPIYVGTQSTIYVTWGKDYLAGTHGIRIEVVLEYDTVDARYETRVLFRSPWHSETTIKSYTTAEKPEVILGLSEFAITSSDCNNWSQTLEGITITVNGVTEFSESTTRTSSGTGFDYRKLVAEYKTVGLVPASVILPNVTITCPLTAPSAFELVDEIENLTIFGYRYATIGSSTWITPLVDIYPANPPEDEAEPGCHDCVHPYSIATITLEDNTTWAVKHHNKLTFVYSAEFDRTATCYCYRSGSPCGDPWLFSIYGLNKRYDSSTISCWIAPEIERFLDYVYINETECNCCVPTTSTPTTITETGTEDKTYIKFATTSTRYWAYQECGYQSHRGFCCSGSDDDPPFEICEVLDSYCYYHRKSSSYSWDAVTCSSIGKTAILSTPYGETVVAEELDSNIRVLNSNTTTPPLSLVSTITSAEYPSLVYGPEGNIYIGYTDGGTLYLKVSWDLGVSWRSTMSLITGNYGILVCDADGNMFAGAVQEPSTGIFKIAARTRDYGDETFTSSTFIVDEAGVDIEVEDTTFSIDFGPEDSLVGLFTIAGESSYSFWTSTDLGLSWRRIV